VCVCVWVCVCVCVCADHVPSSTPRPQDLIAFIRSLPEEQQLALTQDAPDFTLDCMRKLVDLALARAIPTVGCVRV